MPVSFGNFISEKYKDLNKGMKKIYGSQDKFKKSFVANGGVEKWLQTLRDQEISLGLTNSIVRTYIQELNRTPQEMPTFLATICRDYNVEIPAVEGILTSEYWEQKCEQMHWSNKRMDPSNSL